MRVSATVILFATLTALAAAAQHRVIFDTDFVLPPQDDGYALLLALGSPEIAIDGVTTVEGNVNQADATAQVLKLLEAVGRDEVPVYQGATLPLVHRKSEFATRRFGTWWSDAPAAEPPGGFARKKPQAEDAADFIVSTVMSDPGEITIVAIGPLTNIATALSREPRIASAVKSVYIMGGAIAILPDGAGNQTPNAEFNFWVDPEAAHMVLRSGMPIVLSPLNVSRKALFPRSAYEEILSDGGDLAGWIRNRTRTRLRGAEWREFLMYDQLAVASLIDSSLFEREQVYVDVDTQRGINYGVSVGGESLWPGADGAHRITVDHDVDVERFMRLFVERVKAAMKSN